MAEDDTALESGYARVEELAEKLLVAEKAGQRIGIDDWYALSSACDSLGIDGLQHYRWLRGDAPPPQGKHGPFPGERCIYCGSNQFDVDLYTLAPDECPPRWGCGASHPTERLPYCQLDPQHTVKGEPHAYEWCEGATLTDEVETELAAAGHSTDPARVEGPDLLRRVTWTI